MIDKYMARRKEEEKIQRYELEYEKFRSVWCELQVRSLIRKILIPRSIPGSALTHLFHLPEEELFLIHLYVQNGFYVTHERNCLIFDISWSAWIRKNLHKLPDMVVCFGFLWIIVGALISLRVWLFYTGFTFKWDHELFMKCIEGISDKWKACYVEVDCDSITCIDKNAHTFDMILYNSFLISSCVFIVAVYYSFIHRNYFRYFFPRKDFLYYEYKMREKEQK